MTPFIQAAPGRRYVLVTAAYNEQSYIRNLLASVVSQTCPPERWIVVSDASADGTDAIVREYAERYPFVQLRRIVDPHARNFAAQVHAINRGFRELRGLQYDYIGNLDADISLEPDYFERLIGYFERDPLLGLAGGMIYEQRKGVFRYRPSNNVRSVAHGVQLFRRACLETVGAYLPLPYGGPDWYAEIRARMNGWRVQAFPALRAFHHRSTGNASGLLRYCYRQGFMDHALGSHPLFEVLKCLRRVREKPFIVGAVARLGGFASAYRRGERRPVSQEFIQCLRAEQLGRVRLMLTRRFVRGTRARLRDAGLVD